MASIVMARLERDSQGNRLDHRDDCGAVVGDRRGNPYHG
ncbi:hypothetical protein I548_4854 [Mycobacterium intracellulare]|nr:hypothetical protein I548_4854 [Mycobacterium intracellulare]